MLGGYRGKGREALSYDPKLKWLKFLFSGIVRAEVKPGVLFGPKTARNTKLP